MKKILIILIVLLSISLTACVNEGDNEYDFLFTDEELTVQINDIEELPLTLENLTLSDMNFTILDPSIINITGTYIRGIQLGETTITASSPLIPEVTKTITVTVINFKPMFNTIKDLFEVGDKTNIRLTNAKKEDFNWSVDNPTIGELDENNWFTALSKGVVKITATSKTDSTSQNTLIINIIEKKPVITATTSLFQIGDTVTIYLESFNDYSVSDYNWSVSDPEVISIKPAAISIGTNYIVTGLKNGTSEVIATLKTDPRVTTSYPITVGTASTTLSRQGEPSGGPIVLTGFNSSATVQAGEALEFAIAGSKDFYNYRWTSSDTSIVQATDEGVIYGVKEGRAKVTIALKEDLSIRGNIIVNVVGEPNVDYRARILEAADSQLGTRSGTNNSNRFTDWYPFVGAEWCAIFVSWSANQAGISTDTILKFQYSPTGWEWFTENSTTYLREEYTPLPGDIIFFSDFGDLRLTHVGIVVEARLDEPRPYIYTIEGNTSNQVAYRERYLDNNYIYGYGVPNYPKYTK